MPQLNFLHFYSSFDFNFLKFQKDVFFQQQLYCFVCIFEAHTKIKFSSIFNINSLDFETLLPHEIKLVAIGSFWFYFVFFTYNEVWFLRVFFDCTLSQYQRRTLISLPKDVSLHKESE